MGDRVILFSLGAMDLLLALLYVEGVLHGRPESAWELVGVVAFLCSFVLFLVGELMGIRAARRPERKTALWIALGIGMLVLVGTGVGLAFIAGVAGRVPPAALALLLLGAGHVAIACLVVASLVEPDERTRLSGLLEEMRRRG